LFDALGSVIHLLAEQVSHASQYIESVQLSQRLSDHIRGVLLDEATDFIQ
jgi:hypothetical protein